MPFTRSERLRQKAEAALLGAIEVYNKPDFRYREETFAILMLNAWELLLKAKLLLDRDNDFRCLVVYETRRTRSGAASKKQFIKKNRSGNPSTKSIGQVMETLDESVSSRLNREVRDNINALVEIRDNAIHYFNPASDLAKQILEIGTASVLNFVQSSRQWFGLDLSRYSLYLMPVGFTSAVGMKAVTSNPTERNLLRFLQTLARDADTSSPFHVALDVDVRLRRAPSGPAATVNVARDGATDDVVTVMLSEEDIRQQYPWDYKELLRRLGARYSDFKANNEFHNIRKPLMADSRFVKTRYLDPSKPSSGRKDFYNPNILQEFDKRYALA
jgi:hypothetical protein